MIRGRHRDDRGAAIVELTWLGLLLLVPLAYGIVSIAQVQSAAYAVSAASDAGARAFVLAPDTSTAYERARTAARAALDDQGVDASTMALEVTCEPVPTACLQAGSRVTVVVSARRVLPLAPTALGIDPGVDLDSTTVESIGTHQESRP